MAQQRLIATRSRTLLRPPTAQTSGTLTNLRVEISVTVFNVATYELEVRVDGVLTPAVKIGPTRHAVDLQPSALVREVTWEVSAQNRKGTATAEGAITVPASLTKPLPFTVGDWSLTELVEKPDSFTVSDWSLAPVPTTATKPDPFAVGDWSIVNAPTGNEQPNPPGNLTAPQNFNVEIIDDRSFRFIWSPPASGTATSYTAEYSLDDGVSWVGQPLVTSPYVWNNLPRGGAEYLLRVAAVNAGGRVNTTAIRRRTHTRAYGIAADWNQKIADILARGVHPTETYLREVLWRGNNVEQNRPLGTHFINFFSRDYTYAVYSSDDAGGNFATCNVAFGNWRTGQVPWNPSWTIPDGTDAQFIILNTRTGEEWNAWQVAYDAGTNRIVPKFGTGGRVSRITAAENDSGAAGNFWTKTNGFRPSRGCGIQYLAMLVRPEEIAQGKIYHALSVVMRRSGYRFYCAPATKGERYDGNQNDQGVPQGTRFYLDVTDAEILAHVNSWPAGIPQSTRNTMRIVLKAMQEYGFIATDQGGDNHLQFQHTASANWEPYGIDREYVAGGRSYPRDAIDGLISDPSKIKVLPPPDATLYRYERGGDSPLVGPVPCQGIFSVNSSLQQITTIGLPAITRSGSVLTLSRRAQFIGEAPMTRGTPEWYRSGTSAPIGTGLTYTLQGADTGRNITCVDPMSNPIGTGRATSNAIFIA